MNCYHFPGRQMYHFEITRITFLVILFHCLVEALSSSYLVCFDSIWLTSLKETKPSTRFYTISHACYTPFCITPKHLPQDPSISTSSPLSIQLSDIPCRRA